MKRQARERRYYDKHREEILDYQKTYYEQNRVAKRKYIADRLRDAKIAAVMLLGGKCMECDWDEHPAALQFHHRDPALKKFAITANALTSPKKYPKEMILEEIDKCDLLCANCHFIEESVWEIEEGWNE